MLLKVKEVMNRLKQVIDSYDDSETFMRDFVETGEMDTAVHQLTILRDKIQEAYDVVNEPSMIEQVQSATTEEELSTIYGKAMVCLSDIKAFDRVAKAVNIKRKRLS